MPNKIRATRLNRNLDKFSLRILSSVWLVNLVSPCHFGVKTPPPSASVSCELYRDPDGGLGRSSRTSELAAMSLFEFWRLDVSLFEDIINDTLSAWSVVFKSAVLNQVCGFK